MTMPYDEIAHLRSVHPAWALLRANNAALVLSILGRVFVEANVSGLPASTLVAELDEELFALNQRLDDPFPKPPAAYLDDWAAAGWLRKYYVSGTDEAQYDLCPAVEKVLLWVHDLRAREFVGTESRLNTIFELLRQMVYGAETDPARRLTELRRRREALDAEIARAEHGDVELLDDVGQRDRYQQFARTARELLSDFREVEENFRQLDRRLREQITGWAGSKGELLDEVLDSRNNIAESDQGRSFRGFYDFLLSADRRSELTDLLDRLHTIDNLADFDPRLTRIHFDWIDASERTQATVRRLSEQLRRFLDDQVWFENRRIFDVLRRIEANALRLRHSGAPGVETELDDTKVSVVLPTERPLYRPSQTSPLAAGPLESGDADFDSSVLLDQVHIDREVLIQRVLRTLGRRPQVPLDDVIAEQPLEHGLAELIAYLALRAPGLEIVFDDDGRARIAWAVDDVERVADLPRVTFARHASEDHP